MDKYSVVLTAFKIDDWGNDPNEEDSYCLKSETGSTVVVSKTLVEANNSPSSPIRGKYCVLLGEHKSIVTRDVVRKHFNKVEAE